MRSNQVHNKVVLLGSELLMLNYRKTAKEVYFPVNFFCNEHFL